VDQSLLDLFQQITGNLTTFAAYISEAETDDVNSKGVKRLTVAEVWKTVRFFRWMTQYIDRHWYELPFELREEGRTAVGTARNAAAIVQGLSLRTFLALSILQGSRFLSLWLNTRAMTSVFRVIERKLVEQDRRATEAWIRAMAHNPRFAESVKIGAENYDRSKTVEADWATFRPHGS
jgi:hypothetical protein